MSKHVLFIQGGAGQEDYDADGNLVASLQQALGDAYTIHYPLLPEDPTPDFGRMEQIATAIAAVDDSSLILAGHSLGASMLLKYLTEHEATKDIAGLFLISTPFWSGHADWVQPLKLPADFPDKLPARLPIFFYHCKDDEVVPFDQLSEYQQCIPHATFRELPTGGHQLHNDLTVVAGDMKGL